jgi:diguanylate cyclase
MNDSPDRRTLHQCAWRWFSRQVLQLGPLRATGVLTLLVWALAAGSSQLVVWIAGGGNRWFGFQIATVCSLMLTPLLGGLVMNLVYHLELARRQLNRLATTDELTGMNNRRQFGALAEREWARCLRYGDDAALLLIDADHFRHINDRHGRSCGDALLREIARLTLLSLRQPDIAARFVGETLVVFLPQTDPLGALDVAERIRVRVGEFRLDWHGVIAGATVSIGVASLGHAHASLDALIHDADCALHAAKEAGRNCVRAGPIRPQRNDETRPVASR